MQRLTMDLAYLVLKSPQTYMKSTNPCHCTSILFFQRQPEVCSPTTRAQRLWAWDIRQSGRNPTVSLESWLRCPCSLEKRKQIDPPLNRAIWWNTSSFVLPAPLCFWHGWWCRGCFQSAELQSEISPSESPHDSTCLILHTCCKVQVHDPRIFFSTPCSKLNKATS